MGAHDPTRRTPPPPAPRPGHASSPTTSSAISSSACQPPPSSASAPSANNGAPSSTTLAFPALTSHHRHRPRMPLLCLRHDDPPDHPTTPRHFRVRLEAIDLRATCPVIRFTAPARRDYMRRAPRPGSVIGGAPVGPLIVRDEGEFQVHGSCDGVLLVSYKASSYLCNPARRRWTKVPAGTSDGIVGFYTHRPSSEFRMLRRSMHNNTGSVDYDYRILILSPPNTSRGITGGPHSDELLATMRLRPASESPPAIVAGNLHWLPRPNNCSDLPVFDPVSETFRRMRPPPAVEEADGQAQALVELDGKLTVTLTRGNVATAEHWVLQDYEREDSWRCELKVPLPSEADIVHDRPGAVIVVSLEGDVIVQCTQCLLQCDAKGRVLKRHQPAAHHRIIAPRSARQRQWSRDQNWVWGHSVASLLLIRFSNAHRPHAWERCRVTTLASRIAFASRSGGAYVWASRLRSTTTAAPALVRSARARRGGDGGLLPAHAFGAPANPVLTTGALVAVAIGARCRQRPWLVAVGGCICRGGHGQTSRPRPQKLDDG
ncbi:hypothetical protein HU200_045959 [Digitaria exilis]|uniref:F-box associated beta-propeller type 3 domain-containing protein n=1 Tax=Digitaria exilis TaxID=1010633 RepID=A0A835BAC2_9POAL|nr:hypothetical protein HU200_045959 [Digitaria exilis]